MLELWIILLCIRRLLYDVQGDVMTVLCPLSLNLVCLFQTTRAPYLGYKEHLRGRALWHHSSIQAANGPLLF